MTWAEFKIRSIAYWRMQDREDVKFREVAWNALIGSHADRKKIPKTKQRFWTIGKKQQSKSDEAMQNAIKQAQEDYFKQLKEKKQLK